MTKTLDQTFKSLNSKLETTKAPYDPFSQTGDPKDTAAYLVQPGVHFIRPWLAIRGGPAFQWPLGLEGYTLAIDPLLGIHKFIGDNAVVVDVLHAGEEHFTMSGMFPGNSSPALIRALRDLVYQGSPAEGKILFVPEIMSYAQRVQVVHFESSRVDTDRGRDSTYSIEFVRLGLLNAISSMTLPVIPQPPPPSTVGKRSKSTRSVTVDAQHNTIRKIAKWKLGDTTKWRTIFNANEKYFTHNKIPLTKAPDHRLPTGMKVYL
jgi:hypothetical protein